MEKDTNTQKPALPMSQGEKYKGPGRVLGTLGGMSVAGMLSWPVILIGGSKNLWTGLVSLGMQIAGGIVGYRKAEQGEQQFYQNQREMAKLELKSKIMEHKVAQRETENTQLLKDILSKGEGAVSPERVKETQGTGINLT